MRNAMYSDVHLDFYDLRMQPPIPLRGDYLYNAIRRWVIDDFDRTPPDLPEVASPSVTFA